MFHVNEYGGYARVVLAWGIDVTAPDHGPASSVVDGFAKRAIPVFSDIREVRVIRLRLGKQHQNVTV